MVKKVALLQYLLIILLFYFNDSFLYLNVLSKYARVILAFFALIMLLHKRTIDVRNVMFLGLMMFYVVFVRLYSGGVGINVWNTWALHILVTTLAIRIDTDSFLNRFGKVVVFFACCSLVFYVIGLFLPNLYQAVSLFKTVETTQITKWYSSSSYRTENFYEYGLILYSLRDYDNIRNNGVFGEPGLYQMILTTLFFLLLFFRNLFYYTNKQYKRYLIIIIVTIISTQSTAGIIGLGVSSLSYFIVNQNASKEEKTIKNKLIMVVFVATLVMGLDYIFRGSESILYRVFIYKMFKNGTFSVSEGSVSYRMVTIYGCILSLIKYPLGLGYDKLNANLFASIKDIYVGAQFLLTGAALGVIPFVSMIFWLFSPIIRKKSNWIMVVTYIFLFFNSALSQSKEFYPALIVVPIYFSITKKTFSFTKNKKEGNTDIL